LLKILLIHEVSYRKKVIFEMHEFPELLSLRGHDVTFLDFDEGRKFWQAKQAPRREIISGRVHAKAKIDLVRPLQLGIPGLDRILATLTGLPTLDRLLKKRNFDVVVLYAVPTYGLQTICLAKKHNVPVIFRALDVSHKIRSSLLGPIIKWVEKRIYKNADLLSANNPAMAKYCEELSKRTGKTVVHFPPLDLSHFQNYSRDLALRSALGITAGDQVIVYMGSFFYFSGLVDALDEFAEISKSTPNLKLLLVGGGEQDAELRQRVSALGLSEKVIFTGFVSYEGLPRYLKVADVAINTLEPTLVANVAFPNKVLQYMAAGLPVVSTKLDGLYSVFENQAGIVWADDARAVIREASKLLEQKSFDPGGAKANLSQFGLSEFDPVIAVDRFEANLKALAGRSKR
jgi:glycosyltransferase involved in cell wall biosynthesis